nr:Sec-independent protein translocase protein TatB [uncultured Cohaesibacter sp.]
MFDVGWSEILVVVIITILVVGPKELPGLLRTVGKTVGNVRRMASDFQNQFNQALREAELDGVADTLNDVRNLNPRNAVKNAVTKQLGDLSEVTDDVDKSIRETTDHIHTSLSEKAADAAEVAEIAAKEADGEGLGESDKTAAPASGEGSLDAISKPGDGAKSAAPKTVAPEIASDDSAEKAPEKADK